MSKWLDQFRTGPPVNDPFDPFSQKREQLNKAMGRFYAKAKVKHLGRQNWYAYIPGETPLSVRRFLKSLLQADGDL